MDDLALITLAVTKVWQAHTYVYSFVGALLLSTALIFTRLWWVGRLDMGEGPKYHMMREDHEEMQWNGERHG